MGSGTGRHCPDARDVWADLCGYGTESGSRGPCDGDFLQAFDTLPHNSMVVTVLAACDVTHRQGYKPIFVTSVLFPFILVIVAVILGTMGLV